MIRPTTIWKTTSASLRLGICLLLLGFFVMGSSHLELLHKSIYTHTHAVSHSEADERDSCHRAIYHDADLNGCEHNFHLVATDKCELCDFISQSDQIVFLNEASVLVCHSLVDAVFESPQFATLEFSILSSRAPPTI
jgi:hypothetical protein